MTYFQVSAMTGEGIRSLRNTLQRTTSRLGDLCVPKPVPSYGSSFFNNLLGTVMGIGVGYPLFHYRVQLVLLIGFQAFSALLVGLAILAAIAIYAACRPIPNSIFTDLSSNENQLGSESELNSGFGVQSILH